VEISAAGKVFSSYDVSFWPYICKTNFTFTLNDNSGFRNQLIPLW
jgi:hypothetical protein